MSPPETARHVVDAITFPLLSASQSCDATYVQVFYAFDMLLSSLHSGMSIVLVDLGTNGRLLIGLLVSFAGCSVVCFTTFSLLHNPRLLIRLDSLNHLCNSCSAIGTQMFDDVSKNRVAGSGTFSLQWDPDATSVSLPCRRLKVKVQML